MARFGEMLADADAHVFVVMQTSEERSADPLTDLFIDGAAAALAEHTAVIFFDATEKMTSETEKWVWSKLIPAACEGRMGNAKFVLCGRRAPQIEDRMLAAAIEVRELQPLTRDYIHAYLQRRGVEEVLRRVRDPAALVHQGQSLRPRHRRRRLPQAPGQPCRRGCMRRTRGRSR